MIKQRLLQYLDLKGISRYKFYKETGLSNGFLDKEGAIGSDKCEIIFSHYPDISPEWLLTGKGEMLRVDTTHTKAVITSKTGLPLIPIEAIAGYSKGALTITEEDIQERYIIPEFNRKGAKYIIKVSGSSMQPKYSNGDLLACKPIEDISFIQWGKPYVLDTDQGALVKRLFPVDGEPDVFECRSDNTAMYPPFKIHRSSIYKVAIVVGVLRLE